MAKPSKKKKLNYRKERVGSRPISYVHQGEGKKKKVLFCHGATVRVKFYSKLIKALAEKYEVIAPEMYAINQFKNQPKSIREYGDITLELMKKLKVENYHIVGHCMGAAVGYEMTEKLKTEKQGPRSIVGLSPTLPVPYGWGRLFARILKLEWNVAVGKQGGRGLLFALKAPIPFLYNFFRDVDSSKKMFKDITDFSHKYYLVDQPTLLLHVDKDEIYELTPDIKEEIKRHIPNVKMQSVGNLRHCWPIYQHEVAALEIHKFISSQK